MSQTVQSSLTPPPPPVRASQVLGHLGVWILDTSALGSQARNPLIHKYAMPCTSAGILAAIRQALFPSESPPAVAVVGAPAASFNVTDATDALDFGPGGTARRRVDSRFQSVLASLRDALRMFLADPKHAGDLTLADTELLKALPIFRVHGGQSTATAGGDSGDGGGRYGGLASRRGSGGVTFTSVSGAVRLFLAPHSSDSALLGPEFAVDTNKHDAQLLEDLGVERLGKAAFFREHVLPRVATRSLPLGEYGMCKS